MGREVIYFYNEQMGNYHFGCFHPMKPHRATITDSLIRGYRLYDKMAVYRPYIATQWDFKHYHTLDYIDCLRTVTPQSFAANPDYYFKYSLGESDCPVFDGMFDYCSLYTGASLQCAAYLNDKKCDIAINWAGGLHHAQRDRASGFCYVNDIVLAVLELLKCYPRVLYIDIDIHHGDGVQNAFYLTDRVMTLSFHKYGTDFFPGTGSMYELGVDRGKYYSLNIPLNDGIEDDNYVNCFKSITDLAVKYYSPNVVVLQCGADSLNGDRLGTFNLSVEGHGRCIDIVKNYNLPTLVLGGGGYNMKNVAKCWTYETSILLDHSIPPQLPEHDYTRYFDGDNNLFPRIRRKYTDKNNKDYFHRITAHMNDILREMPHAPSMQLTELNKSFQAYNIADIEDELNPDIREHQVVMDRTVMPENEFYDRDDPGRSSSEESPSPRVRRPRATRKPITVIRKRLARPIRMELDTTDEDSDGEIPHLQTPILLPYNTGEEEKPAASECEQSKPLIEGENTPSEAVASGIATGVERVPTPDPPKLTRFDEEMQVDDYVTEKKKKRKHKKKKKDRDADTSSTEKKKRKKSKKSHKKEKKQKKNNEDEKEGSPKIKKEEDEEEPYDALYF